MKLILPTFLLLAATTAPTFAIPTTLAQWTFEVNTPLDSANSTTQSALPDVIGTGTATGVHASAATDWTTPVGNGSPNSWSSNNWGIGDYWQFQVGTLGFEDITLSWDQTSSGRGPRDFTLRYGTDGTNWTDFASYQVLANDWAAGSLLGASAFSFNLSAVGSVDNASSVYFQLRNTSTAGANGTQSINANGTDRLDNFRVAGTAIPVVIPPVVGVPETSPGIAGLAGALALMAAFRHRWAR